MKKRKNITKRVSEFLDEPMEWLRLSAVQRVRESTKLWQLYLSLGGSLDAEPDPQSPFDFLYR